LSALLVLHSTSLLARHDALPISLLHLRLSTSTCIIRISSRTKSSLYLRMSSGTPSFSALYASQTVSGYYTANASTYRNPHEPGRWEEHTSELQSRGNLVCRVLLE